MKDAGSGTSVLPMSGQTGTAGITTVAETRSGPGTNDVVPLTAEKRDTLKSAAAMVGAESGR